MEKKNLKKEFHSIKKMFLWDAIFHRFLSYFCYQKIIQEMVSI